MRRVEVGFLEPISLQAAPALAWRWLPSSSSSNNSSSRRPSIRTWSQRTTSQLPAAQCGMRSSHKGRPTCWKLSMSPGPY